jgi:hypothetical protein
MPTAVERGEHGRTSYRYGCRCRVCVRDMRQAAREQWALRQLHRGRGQVAFRVSTAGLVRHLRVLQAAGWSLRQIAARAGCAPSTLSRAQRSGTRVSALVAHAVMAIEP